MGKFSCEQKANHCENPINLFGARVSGAGSESTSLSEQENGTCPVKFVKGKLIDFRCCFCRTLPRTGCANRSELYR